MNEELRDAFNEIKQDVRDAHAETREHISDFGKALNKHMLEDALVAEKFRQHMEEEARARKWRAALSIAAWGAFVTVVFEAVSKYFIK